LSCSYYNFYFISLFVLINSDLCWHENNSITERCNKNAVILY
jgi:hypothetical protein